MAAPGGGWTARDAESSIAAVTAHMGSRRSQVALLQSLLLLGLWLGAPSAAEAATAEAIEGPQELADARNLVRDAVTYLRGSSPAHALC